jgi:hypothetical protein
LIKHRQEPKLNEHERLFPARAHKQNPNTRISSQFVQQRVGEKGAFLDLPRCAEH